MSSSLGNPEAVVEASVMPTFSSTKRQILLILKRKEEGDLEYLSKTLRISKMAVYKHVKDLEHRGLVERHLKRGSVGRPRLALSLTPASSALFPKAYSTITCAALEFIEEKLGRDAVETALRRRQTKVLEDYRKRVQGLNFDDKVKELAKIRDSEGYMAEVKKTRAGNYELLEFNCPILAVANRYWEACAVERELFQRLLNAQIETTHRAAAGDHVCRFLIRPKSHTATFSS